MAGTPLKHLRLLASLLALVAAPVFAQEDDEQTDPDDAKILERLMGGVTAGAPPEVKAVMKKMEDGKDLTPAEEKLLQQWMMKRSGQGPKELPTSVEERPADAPAQCLGPVKAAGLTDAEWKTLSSELRASWTKALGPKSVAELDAAIAKAKRPVDVADLGAVLFFGRAFTQAGYVLLVHLSRVPEDAVAVSHLALVLSAKGRTKDALQVHLRAKAKTKAALVQTNTGHALLQAGDCAAAKAAFDVAEASVPTYGPMLAGQAMVAALQGRDEDANRYLKASRRQQHSPTAENVVDEATDSTEQRPQPSRRTQPPEPPGTPRLFWPPVPGYTMPMPPTGVGIEQLVANLPLGTQWLADRQKDLDEAGKRTKAAIDAVKAARTAQATRVRLGPSVSIPTPDSPAVAAFWAAYKEYDQGMRGRTEALKQVMTPSLADLGRRYGQNIKDQAQETQSRCSGRKDSAACIEAVNYEFCGKRKALAGTAYTDFEGTWGNYAGGTKRAFEQFWVEAGRPMEVVRDPATRKMLYEFRRTILRREQVALGGVVTAWRSGMAPGVFEVCVKPAPASPPPPLDDPPFKPAPTCPNGKLKVKVFAVSGEYACDSTKVEFTMIVNAAREDNLRTGETTIYLGLGVAEDIGIAELGMKAGFYVTVNADGEPVDIGHYQSRSVGIFGQELEYGGRIGLSGIQASASATLGTPGPVGVGVEAWNSGTLDIPFSTPGIVPMTPIPAGK